MGTPQKISSVKEVLDATEVTVTVGENATIFEGPDTVYRYDLPGSGVTEGWALAAVVDQIKQLTSLYWPEIEVIVDADEAATDILTRTLLNKGVAAYPKEAMRETPLPVAEELEIERPTSGSTHRSLGIHPLHVVIAAVILVVAGVAWWAIDSATTRAASDPRDTAAVATPVSSGAPTSTPASASSSATTPASTPSSAPGVVLEHSGLRVSVPQGFRAEAREDMVMVVGPDPDLRILISADPVHSVPADAVYQEIERMINDDPALHHGGGDGEGRLFYREEPGDGSEVGWSTWVTPEHQFSVGCHTRQSPNLPQQAACRMAVESLGLGE
ncbi:hypothetical protein COCCU_02580 [Corynebacterium occultum]|uniref:Type VII secretion-associated protein n=1 Tax=Corynebacterium occultum TaxID=2675219 RepID=A0A6B8W8Y9_9CORY|nr:type VII secretion-associated protein [Corynebacterium occultum]QGU06470.1 hypothetical protein COCCU_02580 [Corynebacterium occultum]